MTGRALSTRLLLAVSAALAGCRPGPTAPSSAPAALLDDATAAANQAAVKFALRQSIFNVGGRGPITLSTGPQGEQVLSVACPGGGSMSVTSFPPSVGSSMPTTASTTGWTDYDDCHVNYSMPLVVHGDPYVLTVSEFTVGPVVGELPTFTHSSSHQTGGVLFTASGVQGRARYDCTVVQHVEYASGNVTQFSIEQTGTISWEQPLGAPVETGACFP